MQARTSRCFHHPYNLPDTSRILNNDGQNEQQTFAAIGLLNNYSMVAASWQKLLDHILKDVDNTYVYLDDILCFGKNKEDHDATLNEVFKKLAENNMSLSLEKCIFGKSEVEYLGYNVTPSGIRPLPKKLDALDKFKERFANVPNTLTSSTTSSESTTKQA